MSVWFAALLGIVQGLTEFLPVSSSGHLTLLQGLTGLSAGEDALAFDVWLHLGTLISVCVCFRRELCALLREMPGMAADCLRGRRRTTPERRMIGLLALATLPMAPAPLLRTRVEGLFSDPLVTGLMLLVTAALLAWADGAGAGRRTEKDASWRDALTVGLAQLCALIPGLSRSGATVSAGMLRGFDRGFAVRFSFLLSLPVIVGANALELPRVLAGGIRTERLLPYAAGMLCAAISGCAAIRLMRRAAERASYRAFSVYCAAAGLAAVIFVLFQR